MSPQPFTLEFGALAPSISQQLKTRGLGSIDRSMMARWEDCARSLCVVRLHSLVPAAVTHRGEQRLAKRICQWLVEHKKLIPVEK